VTPPQVRRAFTVSPPQSRGTVHRSQSQLELGAQYQNSRPIYQTSGHREPSPVYSTPSPLSQQHFIPPQVEQQPRLPPVFAPAPAPLLPSFLQDIVQSPTLSPSSTSSADLSLDEYDGTTTTSSSSPSQVSNARSRQTSGDSSNLNFDNIWRLDGEETKSLSGFRLPRTDLVSNSRKSSLEKLRC